MMLAHWEFCGLGIKKGKLFGRYAEFPLITVSLLVAKVTLLSDSSSDKLREALRGLCRDPEWLVKNNAAVEKARDQAFQEVHARAADARDHALKRSEKERKALYKEVQSLRLENRTLRGAIQLVSEPS